MKKTALFTVLLTPLLIASGCTSPPDDYPSLAIRDVERVNAQMKPPSAADWAAPQISGDTLSDVSSLTRKAQTAHAAFLEAEKSARGPIEGAAGSPLGSEKWSIAQIALAELGTKRNDALIALADLDRIYVAASTAGEALGQIRPAQQQVERLVEQENRIIDELAGQLE